MRIRATENIEEAQKTLAGITRLVDKIEEMKVGEGVRGKVLGAVERLETVCCAAAVTDIRYWVRKVRASEWIVFSSCREMR